MSYDAPQIDCQHRALQLCKVQDKPVTIYVCGRCASKFQVERLEHRVPVRKACKCSAPRIYGGSDGLCANCGGSNPFPHRAAPPVAKAAQPEETTK